MNKFKKIAAALLIAVAICSLFVISSSAEESVHTLDGSYHFLKDFDVSFSFFNDVEYFVPFVFQGYEYYGFCFTSSFELIFLGSESLFVWSQGLWKVDVFEPIIIDNASVDSSTFDVFNSFTRSPSIFYQNSYSLVKQYIFGNINLSDNQDLVCVMLSVILTVVAYALPVYIVWIFARYIISYGGRF